MTLSFYRFWGKLRRSSALRKLQQCWSTGSIEFPSIDTENMADCSKFWKTLYEDQILKTDSFQFIFEVFKNPQKPWQNCRIFQNYFCFRLRGLKLGSRIIKITFSGLNHPAKHSSSTHMTSCVKDKVFLCIFIHFTILFLLPEGFVQKQRRSFGSCVGAEQK